jgi:hypothetical protein
MMFLPVDGQVVAAFAALGISSYINYCARQDKGAAIRAISAPARRKKGPREASHLKKSIFFARAALAGFQERFGWYGLRRFADMDKGAGFFVKAP